MPDRAAWLSHLGWWWRALGGHTTCRLLLSLHQCVLWSTASLRHEEFRGFHCPYPTLSSKILACHLIQNRQFGVEFASPSYLITYHQAFTEVMLWCSHQKWAEDKAGSACLARSKPRILSSALHQPVKVVHACPVLSIGNIRNPRSGWASLYYMRPCAKKRKDCLFVFS